MEKKHETSSEIINSMERLHREPDIFLRVIVPNLVLEGERFLWQAVILLRKMLAGGSQMQRYIIPIVKEEAQVD
ncbi:MAG: hypothetical protein RMM98_04060, partial [Acidobacteriota bacterium]|nr:hypothetical protein [Acidobacteriota bacterium]